MPLWTVHHPTGTYTAEQKRDFARDVTAYYTRIGLPTFYVVVVFQEHEAESFLVGGEPAPRAVRVVVEHIAVHLGGSESMKQAARTLDAVIARHTAARALYYEFHVDETPRELWMVDGLEPPPFGSRAEAEWAARNSPAPW
jgi:phenylpyruvate tautomerase PptA (4-oxalocrotonate tautomerase family)